MKGKIFAMFAVFAVGIMLFGGINTAEAATIDEIRPLGWGSVGVSVSTDKAEYNVKDDVEITVSSGLHVMGAMPILDFTTITGASIAGIERVTRVEGWASSYIVIYDVDGNPVYRTLISSLHAIDTGRMEPLLLGAWDSETVTITWDKTDRTGNTVPAGDYTVTAYISGYVEVTKSVPGYTSEVKISADGTATTAINVNEITYTTVTEYYSLEPSTSSVTITLRGNPNTDNPGADHIPDNQGTANNPNL